MAAEPPYAEHLGGWQGPWNFAGAELTAERLERAGFDAVETWLEPHPIVPDDPEHYLRTVCLGYHLEQLPEELRPGYVEAVLERSGEELDYVRLNIDGVGDEDRHAARATASGPRSWRAAEAVLAELGDFELDERLMGGASIDAHGTALTDEVLDACRGADAVLLAAVGGPKWDSTDPQAPRPEQGLLGLRKGLGLFANLRPVRPSPALLDASPLKRERIEGTDLLVVRELTGGIYFGDRGLDGDTAHDTCVYSVAEIERIARVAFDLARRKVTSVDKANVLETSRLWRKTVERMAADEQHAARPHAGRQRRDAAGGAPRRVRRDPHREHVRRHPQRRGGDAHRLAGDAAERLAGRRLGAGAVRARARLGSGHRRQRDGQSAGDVRLGGADAAPRTSLWRTRRLP